MITFAIRKYFLANSMLPDALADIAACLNWFWRFNRNVAFCSERLCVDTAITDTNHQSNHTTHKVLHISK